MTINSYITLDGHKYVVQTNTYIRKWARSFSSQLAANIIRLNFVDRGPGLQTYEMTLMIQSWDPNSLPYKQGITQTIDQQAANLEASYGKIASLLSYIDPLGVTPGSNGVYFTDLNQLIPQYSTNQKPYLLYQVEFTCAFQVVA